MKMNLMIPLSLLLWTLVGMSECTLFNSTTHEDDWQTWDKKMSRMDRSLWTTIALVLMGVGVFLGGVACLYWQMNGPCLKKYCFKFCDSKENKEDDVEAKAELLDEKNVRCYLCHDMILKEKWESGEHRRDCAKKHEENIKMMKEYRHKDCPTCHQPMRFWPERAEHFFYCNNDSMCQSKGRCICNKGHHQLNCFQCNINYCWDCIKHESKIQTESQLFDLKKKIIEKENETGHLEEKIAESDQKFRDMEQKLKEKEQMLVDLEEKHKKELSELKNEAVDETLNQTDKIMCQISVVPVLVHQNTENNL